MQKWEYLYVELDAAPRGMISVKVPHFMNGYELQNWQGIHLPSYINQLGDDGWELVGTLSGGTGLGYGELFFKRAKE